ncbi:MAG: hypothetical protein AB7T86_03755 [Xanthobacteraceae bacterium]|uniref:hypothetical protein n=1 Tax=Pseudolabrys sp. TaxID=1960880 RepID=UPI003D0F9F28
MPGFMPGIHVFQTDAKQDVDGRDKPSHDENAANTLKTQRKSHLAALVAGGAASA